MSGSENVIAFPSRGAEWSPRQSFEMWMRWAECELVILGFDSPGTAYGWRAAFDRGLAPEEAAAEAAVELERQCA